MHETQKKTECTQSKLKTIFGADYLTFEGIRYVPNLESKGQKFCNK